MRTGISIVVLFAAVSCSAATVGAPATGAATACPTIAVVRSFVAARDRADGAAAAALFTSDGYIDGVANYNGTAALPAAKVRYAGPAQIKALVDGQRTVNRSFDITAGPSGCGNEATWTERREFVNPQPPADLRATATVRDGKILSIVYTEAR